MPNNAITTVTVWSPDPAALAAVRQCAAAPSTTHRVPPAATDPAVPGIRSRLAALVGRGRSVESTSGPRLTAVAGHPFSLEAVAPTGMDPDAWDHERATALWGCSRPETDSTVESEGVDRVVYEVVTPYAPPGVALRTLSGAHPGVVVHAVSTCESEYAWTAWFVRGRAVGERETELDLTDEQWEDWDGEWVLPADWAFSAERAAQLAGGTEQP